MNTTPIKKISKRGAVAFLIFSNIFFLIIPSILLFVGFWKLLSCPSVWYLPYWMIFVALLMIIDRLIFWRRLVNETKFEKTFPRPSSGSVERLKTWEKNRVLSTSRRYLCLQNTVKTLFFMAILLGTMRAHDAIHVGEPQCSFVLAWTAMCLCSIVLWLFIFVVVGTIYQSLTSCMSKLKQTAIASLNRLL